MQFRWRYDAISQIHQIKLIEDIRDSSEYYVRNKKCSRKWNPITTVPRHLSDNEIARLQDEKIIIFKSDMSVRLSFFFDLIFLIILVILNFLWFLHVCNIFWFVSDSLHISLVMKETRQFDSLWARYTSVMFFDKKGHRKNIEIRKQKEFRFRRKYCTSYEFSDRRKSTRQHDRYWFITFSSQNMMRFWLNVFRNLIIDSYSKTYQNEDPIFQTQERSN